MIKHECIECCIAERNPRQLKFHLRGSERKTLYSSCHCHSMTVWTIHCIANEVKCEVSKDDTEFCLCEKCPDVKLNCKMEEKIITRLQKGTVKKF